MRFHHVGVAVPSIAAAAAPLAALGFAAVPGMPDHAGATVRLCFLAPPGDGLLVELVEGLGADSPVAALLARNGPIPYHLGFRVDALEPEGRRLRRLGYRPVSPPLAGGIGRTQFFHHPASGLLELVEMSTGAPA